MSDELARLRAELAEIEQALANLEALPAAQREVIMAALRAQREGLRNQVAALAGDGAIAQDHSVAATTGVVSVDGDIHGQVYIGTPAMDSTEALRIYRRVLVSSSRHLPLRGVDLGAADPSSGQRGLGLTRVYIDLNTKTREFPDKIHAVPELHQDRPLRMLEATVRNRRLVILGNPGSGKSTFLNHLALCLAAGWLDWLHGWREDEAAILPIPVVIRDFSRWLPEDVKAVNPRHLWDFIVSRLEAQNLAFAVEPLRQALEEGKAIVLLDGLDEIPSRTKRIAIRNAVSAFARRYDGSRLVATCRVLSYQDPAWRLEGFPAFELAPFNEDQVDSFIKSWYAELVRMGGVKAEDAEATAWLLQESVRRLDLWQLASNPLLLTVMALVHTHKGRLPDARALLYEDTVDILLWRWEQIKASGDDDAPRLRQLLLNAGRTDVDLKRVLWRLAFEVHAEGGAGDSERLMDIDEWRLRKALVELHPKGNFRWAQAMIDTIKLRTGLLLERAPEVYTFTSRTFQEYLAGAYLSSQADFARRATQLAAESAVWREVILLAVGRLVHLGGDTDKPLALVGELCPARAMDDDAAWRMAWLAGEVLLEAGLNRVQESALGRDLTERVRGRLADLVIEGRLVPAERAAAGETLGRLGDPRFREDAWYLPDEPLLGFVEVPAGPFPMGSDMGRDGNVLEREMPQHMVDLPTYYTARYPVTVAQFRAFVQDSGHQTKGPWERFSGSENHPVVDVTWYDALEYCKWLTERLREWDGTPEPVAALLQSQAWEVRLLTEAEWEKAARGINECRFPWGDESDPERANYAATGIGKTSAVGCFPAGASPYGILDLSGNVWEMCNSLYRPYPYRQNDGREDTEAEGTRVLRGGAWNEEYDYSRCTYRGNRAPASYWYYSGFRVAVSAFSRLVVADPILRQVMTFFARASFQTRQMLPDLGEVVVTTSKWVSHSKYGDILVKVFAGDLNGDHLRGMERRIEATGVSHEIAYTVYDGELSDDAYWQMGAYKLGMGLTIVPLQASVIGDILVSQDADHCEKLKSLEQEYLGHSVNRYEESNAIQDATWFFGRRHEADEIMDRLKSNQHVGIFGMRKIGKTSLLLHLKQRCSRESIPVAYLGLQSKPIDPPQLFTDIVRQIRFSIQALGVEDIPECKLLTGSTDQAIDRVFRDDVLALWRVAQRKIKAPSMVVMIDEAERIVPRPGSDLELYRRYDEFFAPIRDLSQTRRCMVSVVTAERPTIREEFDKKLLPNAMFELYDERYLSCFTYEECSNMVVKIGKWMGIEYSPDSLKMIFQETAGHPYVARLFCACLVNKRKTRQVSAEDVEATVEASLGRLDVYLKGWWKNLSEEEKQLLDSVLRDRALPTPMNEEQMDALDYLQKQGLIYQAQNGQWDIAIRLLRRWLERRKGV